MGVLLWISCNYHVGLQPKEGNAFETLMEGFNTTTLGKGISGDHKSHSILAAESKRVSCSLCLTLYNPMDCSLPDSSVHGIFQARILEWVAISFSRGSSPPRDQTQVSRIAGGFFTV